MTFRTHYIPANSAGQHNRARARYGIPPSQNQAMNALLLSDQVQAPTLAAARDIAGEASDIARAELKTAKAGASEYLDSIDAGVAPPIVAGGSPRVAAAVTANGGRASWGGFTDPESSHAAVVEFGNPAAPGSGKRILGRAGARFHNPRAAQ